MRLGARAMITPAEGNTSSRLSKLSIAFMGKSQQRPYQSRLKLKFCLMRTRILGLQLISKLSQQAPGFCCPGNGQKKLGKCPKSRTVFQQLVEFAPLSEPDQQRALSRSQVPPHVAGVVLSSDERS